MVKLNKTEKKVLALIAEASRHTAYLAQDGQIVEPGTGLSWLEFAVKMGRLRDESKKP